MHKTLWILIFIVLTVLAVSYLGLQYPQTSPTQSTSSTPSGSSVQTEPLVVAKGLDTPWAIAFLPDGKMLVTERRGAVNRIDPTRTDAIETVANLPEVRESGEGGLLGIATDPSFSENGFVYLYYTYRSDANGTANRVVRMRYANNTLSEERVLLDGIPGSGNHNGGRIGFGPDRLLYVTTGDAENPSRAQDRGSLGGKILRMTADGKPPADNPYGNLTYTYGHRNAQGLAWDSSGRLWATEHGRSGLQSGLDEVNAIEKGNNYGWPIIQGEETREGMQAPYAQSGPSVTWAPAGAAIVGDTLYFGGLRGTALYRMRLTDPNRSVETVFKNRYGRIREVVNGPDGFLYLTTSNKDGRGIPGPDDDRVIRVDPRSL